MTLAHALCWLVVATLLLSDRLEHLGLVATWTRAGEVALKVAPFLKVACVVLAWLAVASAALSK